MKNGWSDQVIGVYLNIRAKFAAMVFEDTVPEFSGGSAFFHTDERIGTQFF